MTDYGISIISTNNLGFKHFVNIFKRKEAPYNQIPIAVITDADKRQKIAIDTYVTEIKNNNNRVECFIGEQLYSDSDLKSDGKKKTTFEKIIFKNASKLKELYIQAYNSLKSRTENAVAEMDFEILYDKIDSEKAPIAQEVAQLLANKQNSEKVEIKKEIEDKLKYIKDAIVFVIPNTILNKAAETTTE